MTAGVGPRDRTQRVYLHIGVPKSGTSFIQATLRDNKQELMQHGVLFPNRHKGDMFQSALDVIGHHERWGLPKERVEGRWAQMCGRVGLWPGDAVISSEFFCGATPAQIRGALRHLADAEVHVVVTARDLARQLPAEWQEGIKHGRNVSFTQFRRRILAPRRQHPHARRFWHYQDLPAVLARWAAEVGEERVHLVTCPPPGAEPDVLWRRFCSVVGIEPDWVALPEGSANVSLGVVEIDVLRRVNRAARRQRGERLDSRMVKQHLVREVLRHTGSPRAVTPPDVLPTLDTLTGDWKQQIRGHRYDVVGDLADLDPVRLPAADLDPDKIPPRQSLRVSSTAIVTLLTQLQQSLEDNAELRRELFARRPLWRRAGGRARRTLHRVLRR